MAIEWVSTARAACAFLIGVVVPALIHDFSGDSATEKTRIEQHGSLRGEGHAGGS